MSDIEIGVNLVYVTGEGKSFREGIRIAAEQGYQYVEPCVAPSYDLLALAGYYHMLPMEDDPLEVKEWLDELGLKPSAVSSHTMFMRPEVSIPYLSKAIRYAADLGAPVVTTDEGAKPEWMSDDEAFQLMGYTVRQVTKVAERHGIKLGLEPHQQYSVKRDTFLRLLELSDSPSWQVNFDTGNYYLGGHDDPYEMLETVADRVCHLHAKDISVQQSDSERGEVTGTSVGCACGDGVIDWPRVLDIVRRHNFKGVLCVECGTIDEAKRSLEYLSGIL